MADHLGSKYQVASDNFDRADNSSVGMNLGSNWTSSVPQDDLGIISNAAYQTADAGDNAAFYSASSFANDQYSTVTLSDATGASGVIVRANATDYVLGQFSTPNYKIYWYNGGAYTQIATGAGSIANGDILELRAVSQTFYLYKNGTLVISGSSSTAPSSGNPGIVIENPSSRLNDWAGGNIVNLQIKGVSLVKGVSSLKSVV